MNERCDSCVDAKALRCDAIRANLRVDIYDGVTQLFDDSDNDRLVGVIQSNRVASEIGAKAASQLIEIGCSFNVSSLNVSLFTESLPALEVIVKARQK